MLRRRHASANRAGLDLYTRLIDLAYRASPVPTNRFARDDLAALTAAPKVR